MSSPWRKRFLIILAVVLVVLVALVLVLQASLGSGVGRGVVESRLSAALGRPVRLDGEFELRLLPLPGISGTSLRIFTSDARWLLLDAQGYYARVALGPLLDGEIEVVALQMDHAVIDAARLAAEPAIPREPGAPFFQMPDIHALDLQEVSVFFDGMQSEPYLHITELALEGFSLDEPSPYEAEFAWVSKGENLIDISVAGSLTLRPEGQAEASLSGLDVRLTGWAMESVEGSLSADFTASGFRADLDWQGSEQVLRLAMQLNWNPGFATAEPAYAIEELAVELDGDRIEGKGCLFGESPPALSLILASEEVDLDAFLHLLEQLEVTSGNAEPPQASSVTIEQPGSGEAEDLPFDIAISLELKQATYADALAEGVRLTVGAEPECPEAL